jgi:gamma-glutamyltranspeptidase/glutathione hydrolase
MLVPQPRLQRDRRRVAVVVACFWVALGVTPVVPQLMSVARAAPAAQAAYRDGQVAVGSRFMVVSEQPLATRVGLDVLRNGGNAVDAAVATALALAVVHPEAGNLGGGGFFLFHRNRDSLYTVFDGRETAPAKASRDTYIDAAGAVDTTRLRNGPMAAGVPGSLAALHLAWAQYGRLTWRSLVAPSIKLAQDGFVVTPYLAASIARNQWKLKRDPTVAHLFLPHGKPLRAGDRLTQKDLARTLRLVAQSGALTLHEGAVAEALAKAMQRAGGILTAADLAGYRPVERPALRGTYRDLTLWTVPPPSSGGTTLLQTLAMLSGWQLDSTKRLSVYRTHLEAEAMSRAFADRNTYLGDPDFVPMPLEGLLSPQYLVERRKEIGIERATAVNGVVPGDAWKFSPSARIMPAPVSSFDTLRTRLPGNERDHTTHLSVVDGEGNIVAFTTTLNSEFGSGWMAPATGILLNNQMDDFAAQVGAPNLYGLVGTDTNAIQGGKRPLSSMCPAIVVRDGRPWLVLGSRGGPRIISTVLNILIDMRDYGATLEAAVAAGRFHHQWRPNTIVYEAGALSDEVIRGLQGMGHALRQEPVWGGAHCIEITPGGARRGASDPRRGGAALGE